MSVCFSILETAGWLIFNFLAILARDNSENPAQLLQRLDLVDKFLEASVDLRSLVGREGVQNLFQRANHVTTPSF